MAETRYCALPECGKPFEPKSYNAKYCSIECQKTATNRRLLEKYHEKKAARAGKKRVCKSFDCNTILSRYNSDVHCETCQARLARAKRENIFDILNHIEFRED